MKQFYKVTKESFVNIENYPWLKKKFKLNEIGSKDDREIVRLLENEHYPNIKHCLQIIDKYGLASGEITKNILSCNDSLSFERYLSELLLFSYLYESVKENCIVKSIERIEGTPTPDISITIGDFELLLELYTPMDYYGYKIFSKLITSVLKNLDIDLGFTIEVKLKSSDFFFANNFPDFRDIYKWLKTYEEQTKSFIKNDNCGKSFELDLFSETTKLITTISKLSKNNKERLILYSESTRSSDTRLFFEIKNPEKFSKTEWGVKIYDKLQKQQAGVKKENVLRILTINFSYSDTSDINFFNNEFYYKNLIEDIKFLVKDFKEKPYDLVLPCEIGFDLGFIKPVILTDIEETKINELLSQSGLNKPISKTKEISKKEADKIVERILRAGKDCH